MWSSCCAARGRPLINAARIGKNCDEREALCRFLSLLAFQFDAFLCFVVFLFFVSLFIVFDHFKPCETTAGRLSTLDVAS